ncbi:MAG: Gfo/Idh/MocA family protein [Vulcanimicrobiota bacterium]
MGKDRPLNLCLVGCGGFADFSLAQYQNIEGLKVHSLMDICLDRTRAFEKKYGAEKTFDRYEDALADPDIEIMVIATPPSLHYPQTMQALGAGKHVMCEKPLAVSVEQARKILDTAKEKNLKVFCNYVMRYNPMFRILNDIVKSKVLGPVSSFLFRNYAQDEPLPPEHWFWDRKVSGGIFIEHGVHFFDIMNWILGRGEVAQSLVIREADTDQEKRVASTVIYPAGIPGDHYHGFTQMSIVERNYLQVTFRKGYLTLHEWMPTSITGEIWVTPEEYTRFHRLMFDILPEYTDLSVDGFLEKLDSQPMEFPEICMEADEVVEVEDQEQVEEIDVKWGPHIELRHYSGVEGEWFNFGLSTRIEEGKMPLYSECIKKCMEDFVQAVKNPAHKPAFNDGDIIASLKVAEDSTNQAKIILSR